MVRRHGAKAFERIGMPLDQLYKEGGYWKFKLQPYVDIHLGSAGINNDLLKVGNKRSLYIFGVIALFIVLLACVNFMNLSTARSFNRARETGVRKVMGSSTGKLILQFLSESVLYSIFASILALLMVFIFMPAFNRLTEKQLLFSDILSGPVWLLIIGITLLSGFLAGTYPAFYLSSFKPVQVLKGTLAKKGGSHFIRNSLVVFQFSISVVLIICTVVVLSQLNYMQGKDLGLDKENVLIVGNTQRLGDKEEIFRQELAATNGINAVSISTSIPSGNAFGDGYVPEAGEGEKLLVNDLSIFSYLTDENFIPSLQIGIAKGRNFSKEFSDSASVIINETAARQIGWKEPIGKYLRYPGGDDTRFKVIGVVKDFTVQSFREVLVPFALFHRSSKTYSDPLSFMIVRIQAGNTPQAIASLEAKWKSFAPGSSLDYNFLDARINMLYNNEQRMSNIFLVFALLSIMVACLGLFGLSAFAAEQRTKEIGIRKVLGASVSGIIQMLSKDFLKLVLIATVIAFPVAWWAMTKWLEDFAYRIPIGWWIFLLAGGLALMIALVTVSFQAIKAALMNPVRSLRSE
jgi:putative ABC transport system permease protein